MSDLVERLRLSTRGPDIHRDYYRKDCADAADEIERLRADRDAAQMEANEARQAEAEADAEAAAALGTLAHFGAPMDDRDAAIAWIKSIIDSETAQIRGQRDEARAEAARLPVLREVQAERDRQRAKGYDAAHDDEHRDGALVQDEAWGAKAHIRWAMMDDAFKRHHLIAAAALIVAEIERMDRAALAKEPGHE